MSATTKKRRKQSTNKVMEAKLKELFGQAWATKVAEKGGLSATWVRECFRSKEVRSDVFRIARELIEEELAAREEFRRKLGA